MHSRGNFNNDYHSVVVLYSKVEDADAGGTLDMARPVNGPMIVIRSSQRMGEKMVTILKQYLQHTEDQEIKWQHKADQGLPSWQLFDIV